jgi:hypothetical protein
MSPFLAVASALAGPWLPQVTGLAAAEANPVNVLLNYGVAGIGLFMFAAGRIFSKSTVDRLESRIMEQDRQLELLTRTLANAALPALNTTTEVMRESVSTESALVAELRTAIQEMRRS